MVTKQLCENVKRSFTFSQYYAVSNKECDMNWAASVADSKQLCQQMFHLLVEYCDSSAEYGDPGGELK